MKIVMGVPVHNGLNYTKLFFESLYNSMTIMDNVDEVKLFVIDNDSTDGTVEWIEANCLQTFPWGIVTKLIKLNGNYGTPKSFNTIFKEFDTLDADLCIFCNNDVVFSRGWLAGLLEFHKDFPEDLSYLIL